MRRKLFLCVLMIVGLQAGVEAQSLDKTDAVIDQITKRERDEVKAIEQYAPIVETYIQEMSLKENRLTPSSDHYFISKARLSGDVKADVFKNRENALIGLLERGVDDMAPLRFEFLADGFLNMIFPNPGTFDRQHHRFEFKGREFLGEVRCLVFDVSPVVKASAGMFEGRIWVEDQDLTIVRYNGTFLPKKSFKGITFDYYFHFDSWRFNAGGNLWLPAVVYSEETSLPCCLFWKLNYRKLRFKAQTRLWGYNLGNRRSDQEFAKVLIEAPGHVDDQSESNQDLSPIQAQRAWERQAEDNVLDHLERTGLLAPNGQLDKTLEVVINNLEVTNDLDIQPAIRCRELLTSRLESFTVGHAIVLSKGLIDVIPNEATLASVLAHNLAHILADERVDTRFSFADATMFPARQIFQKMVFKHTEKEEMDADELAKKIMAKSPYKDSLGDVSAFYSILREKSSHIRQLLRANLGDPILRGTDFTDSESDSATEHAVSKIIALPLGSRTRVDPWLDKLEQTTPRTNGTLSQENSLPFEVTPVFPYLRRLSGVGGVEAMNPRKDPVQETVRP